MRIELESLEGPRAGFAHEYTVGELDLEDEAIRLTTPPTVSGRLRREGARVKLDGKIDAQLQLECDRCLKPIDFPVASRFKLEYVTREVYQAQQDLELTEEDLDLTVFDGEVIDVDALVREELLLAVPTQLLCQKDCKGVCSVCGVDRNVKDCFCQVQEIDSRWEGLKELVKGE